MMNIRHHTSARWAVRTAAGLCFLILLSVVRAATPAAAGPRQHLRFDAGWRFHRGNVPGAWQEKFDDAQWRHVELPHDWSIEDLPPAAKEETNALAVVPGAWRFKAGDDPAWKQPAFDDAAWQPVNLPGHWSDFNYKASSAYGWYRRRIAVPAGLRGGEVLLLLGKVDDADETFVNGVKVGGMGAFPPGYASAWTQTRRYRVPAGLFKGDGTDVVAVRDYNGDGDAGIYAAAEPPVRSGPFDADSPAGTAQGYTLGGVGWYRKTFTLPVERGRRVTITFDGVYMNAEVWLNGQPIGRHPYGYTSFSFDLTPQLHFGRGRNVLAVKVDASGLTSRWYSGSGIYRHVWLTVTDPVHVVVPWGLSVTTPEVSRERATVCVSTVLTNETARAVAVALTSRVLDARGHVVATDTARAEFPAAAGQKLEQTLTVTQPALWSPDSPQLYRLVCQASVAGKVVDEAATPFGIRSLSFDVTDGFRLNGQPLKLRGGCVHHDNGCLGSCTYDRAEERRVEILKANGFNAIRTSHNPPSPAFLDACDRLGVLVMDEAFDCWNRGKNPQDYSRFFEQWWRRDLDSMIRRDRNHPCVALWSIGNEIPGQNTAEDGRIGAELAAFARALDPTRPVAQAAYPDDSRHLPVFANLDVCGYNYMAGNYVRDHALNPQRVMAGTESFPMSCFDNWMPVLDHPFVIGDFVWTAFDYLGEAGLGKAVPQSVPPGYQDHRLWTVSNCGDFDLCGFKRPPSYYRDAVWGRPGAIACFVEALGPDGKPERVEGWGWPDERPSWTWPGRESQPVKVRAFASAPQVRLLLNGKDLGAKPTTRATRFIAEWEVPYTPGELTAVAQDAQDHETGRWTLRTAAAPAVIHLAPDRATIAADGQDLSFVTVELRDARGVLNPNATNLVHFSLRGPGRIVGVGNGDPRSVESFQQPQRHAYHGRCLVVIKAGERAGTLHLRAEASGLKGAEAVIWAENPRRVASRR